MKLHSCPTVEADEIPAKAHPSISPDFCTTSRTSKPSSTNMHKSGFDPPCLEVDHLE